MHKLSVIHSCIRSSVRSTYPVRSLTDVFFILESIGVFSTRESFFFKVLLTKYVVNISGSDYLATNFRELFVSTKKELYVSSKMRNVK